MVSWGVVQRDIETRTDVIEQEGRQKDWVGDD